MFKNTFLMFFYLLLYPSHAFSPISLFFRLTTGQNPLSDHGRARPSWAPTPDSLHLLRASASVQGVLCGDGVGDHRRSEPREVLVLETQRTRPSGKNSTRRLGGGAGMSFLSWSGSFTRTIA